MTSGTDYCDYSADDFIKDESFQLWVYFPEGEDSHFWEEFVRLHPEKSEAIEEAKEFLLLLDFSENDVFQSKIQALKNRIDFAIDHPELVTSQADELPGHTHTFRLPIRQFVKVAAAIALLIVAGYAVNRNIDRGDKGGDDVALLEQSTENGERKVISLEDGTKVWLNVASTIRYPESFQREQIRELYLDGEAFFDVAEDKEKPFIVRTDAVQVKVLGTSFNVKSYKKESEIQTTLIKGKVTVESIDDEPKLVTLAPNQVATYHRSSKKIVLDNQPDTDMFSGWKDGRLIFDNTPLGTIVLALERWYNVKITVDDEKSLRCHFSAKIENLTLREVLELFKVSDGIEYEIDGQNVRMRGAICEE